MAEYVLQALEAAALTLPDGSVVEVPAGGFIRMTDALAPTEPEPETPTEPETPEEPAPEPTIAVSALPVEDTSDSVRVEYVVTNGTVTTATFSRDGYDKLGAGPWTTEPILASERTYATFKNLAQQPYTFTVEATLEDGTVLTASATIAPYAPALVAPANLTAEVVNERQVKLTWDAVDGATEYRIYEPSTTGVLATVTEPTRTSPNLSDGTYYYSVTAIVGGEETPRSNEVEVVVPQAAAPTDPTTPGEVSGYNIAEPTLVNPTVFYASGNTGYFRVDDPNQDVLVIGDGKVTKGADGGTSGITVVGGRNVVLRNVVVGHERDNDPSGSDSKSNRMIQIMGNGTFAAPTTTRRTIMVNGLVASGVLKDGVIVDLRGDTNVEVVIQGVDMRDVNPIGSYEENHSDLVQVWNGPAVLRINRLWGVANYQGFFLQQKEFGADSVVKTYIDNVHIEGLPTSAYLLWDSHSNELHVAENGPVTVYSQRYGSTEQPTEIYWDSTQGGKGKHRWAPVQYKHREPAEVLGS
ncbi:fibronectin type III domain-containing protein [Kineococcus esterisolvens]|uniref:hypothetical protein n=1 Tax=unclassified Kineococcus TaxID=2621656 RepID=UPI003D7C42FB